MRKKTVKMSDIAREVGAFTDAHLAALKQATVLGVAKSIPDLVKASPVDTGLYAQSWSFKVLESGVYLGNTAPHAPIIEYGTRPFTPPIKPLLEWAKRVLQDPSQPPDYSPEVWALARGTQNKIARQGMEPRRVMQNAIPQVVENIKAEYKKIGE